MSVESKLDQLIATQATIIANQGALLTAVQSIPGANTSAITDALSQIESQVAAIQTTVGTETAPVTTPPAA